MLKQNNTPSTLKVSKYVIGFSKMQGYRSLATVQTQATQISQQHGYEYSNL